MEILEDAEDKERSVRDFELTQAGLERSNHRKTADASRHEADGSAPTATKRKFSLDEDELDRIAKEDKLKARKAIDDEKVFLYHCLLAILY